MSKKGGTRLQDTKWNYAERKKLVTNFCMDFLCSSSSVMLPVADYFCKHLFYQMNFARAINSQLL